MNDLVKFLRARLDEDEAKAQDAGGNWWFDQPAGLPGTYSLEFGRFDGPSVSETGGDAIRPAEAAHIARHDPTRVLAEVDAKRLLIAEVWDDEEGFPTEHTTARSAEAVLRHLALPYANHPDYQEEWRPV